jgi:uncharacterized membrane protein YebE (DUF533 family)
MSTKLPTQSFLALAAVAWADGTYQKNEGAALLRAAKEHGVEGEALAELEGAIKQRVAVEAVAVDGLSEWEKVLTYALASWIAILDGVRSREEKASLEALGARLGLDAPVCERAAAAAFDISVLPDGRPDRYDFTKLAARLRERLPKLAGPEAAS